jgi:2-polyprenyl-3-methyl-5-hydroxy-6-metoxy-1,4-benzoquinol methylase
MDCEESPAPVISPDNHARGFLAAAPKPDRYETGSADPGDVAAKLAALIPRAAKVLDVGCGTGSISEIIQTLSGATLIGIEPDTQRAMAAQARGLKVFEGYLTKDFLHEHGPFDIILFADVLEHLPDPSELVTLAGKGLAPGGAIVASVPNVAHYFMRLDLLFGRFDYQDCGIRDATHLRWFTRKTICEFFKRLGFRITVLDCTVSVGLADYQFRRPWRWLRETRRRQVVAFLAKKWPALFGCQHIIKATSFR